MRLILTIPVLSIFATGTALAHGPQLQITNDGGKIVTHDVFLDGPYHGPSPVRSVYVMPVLEDGGSWYSRPNAAERPIVGGPVFYSGPGLAFGSQVGTTESFSTGENFMLQFADSLLQWDGTSFVDPGNEQVRSFRGSPTEMSAAATTSDSSPYEALAFAEISSDYDADAHSTARFQFLGDGVDPLVAPDDGVYLLSLSLSSSETGVSDSDEFFYVLHKHAAEADVSAAVAALGRPESEVQYLGQAVPEPATIAYGLLAALSLLARRSRKK